MREGGKGYELVTLYHPLSSTPPLSSIPLPKDYTDKLKYPLAFTYLMTAQKRAAGFAKLQFSGTNKNGTNRFHIYLPKNVIGHLNLQRGNTIGFTMWLQERTEPEPCNNLNAVRNLTAFPKRQKLEKKEPNEQEQEFLNKYVEFTTNGNEAAVSFLTENAIKTFGRARTQILLERQKLPETTTNPPQTPTEEIPEEPETKPWPG